MNSEKAVNFAEAELRKLDTHSGPVQVVKIADSLNLPIYELDFPKYHNAEPAGVIFEKGDKKQWSIIVNENNSPELKRAAIALAIGHFLLHKNESFIDSLYESGLPDYENSSGSKEQIDEAFEFACNLLLPRNLLENHVRVNEHCSVENIATAFDVPLEVAKLRFANVQVPDSILEDTHEIPA